MAMEEFDDENEIILRAKWTIDGSKNLLEAAQKLRDFADYIEQLDKEGWEIIEEVVDDYAFCRKKDEK